MVEPGTSSPWERPVATVPHLCPPAALTGNPRSARLVRVDAARRDSLRSSLFFLPAIAVIGLGAMGSRIARRLLDAGHGVTVWNRTPKRADALVELGAKAAATPAEAASSADGVITMLADPPALHAVTEGTEGVAAGLGPQSTLIEMSTVGPSAIERLADVVGGDRLIDAPVLGSVSQAESGALKVFAGGGERLVERWRPVLSDLGEVLHVGPLGAGARAKLVANSTLFGVLGVLGEALALAEGLGLSREAAFDVLAASPLAAQAERRREAFETGDFPLHFRLALARKDADLIQETGLDLRLAAAARSWIAEAAEAGWGERDYSAVLAWIVGRR
jgi:3-hydroxyisobutyrate dehydrogenase-like beta-hydroxyacid dehydrogenase